MSFHFGWGGGFLEKKNGGEEKIPRVEESSMVESYEASQTENIC